MTQTLAWFLKRRSSQTPQALQPTLIWYRSGHLLEKHILIVLAARFRSQGLGCRRYCETFRPSTAGVRLIPNIFQTIVVFAKYRSMHCAGFFIKEFCSRIILLISMLVFLIDIFFIQVPMAKMCCVQRKETNL